MAVFLLPAVVQAQESDTISVPVRDSISVDTLAKPTVIKPKRKPKSSSGIDKKIERTATDSVTMDLENNLMTYYGNAEVKYGDITITAAVMEFNMKTQVVKAFGRQDSLGIWHDRPHFTQGSEVIDADELRFNFNTQKGTITKVFTTQNEGFIHGEYIKKLDDGSMNVKGGSFTTCDLREHPHFEFRFNKGRVIPDDVIVTGPIFLTIAEVPLPIGLPFAILPNKKGQTSGFIMPSYGESTTQGFYLQDGGWYWILNDNMDLQLLGTIYIRGSWGINPIFRYVQRYKHSGTFNLAVNHNVIGTQGASDYYKGSGFKVMWTHKQDPKARPNSSFSASVNMISPNYNKYNAKTTSDYLSNEFQSSIAYQTNIAQKVFITLNGNQSQNTLNHKINITLPSLTMTVNRFYPLKNVGQQGKKHWYKDFNLNYSMNAKNVINMADSLFFPSFDTPNWGNAFGDYWNTNWMTNMQNGIQHKVSANLPIRLLKHFNWTNTFNFTDRMYFDSQTKEWIPQTVVGGDTIAAHLQTTTDRGFSNLMNFDVSSNLTTKIYGIKYFKRGPLRAIRHVFTPTIGFSYTPDFSTDFWHCYSYYLDQNGEQVLYNRFANGIYGSPGQAESGQITYNFGNNLEIKVPSKNDTITGLKTVKLIESLTFSGNYDLAKDSLNFSYLNVSGRTTLFKKLSLQYSSIWDPYAISQGNVRINQLEAMRSGRLFNKKSSTWNFSLNYTLNNETFKQKQKENIKKLPPQPVGSSEEEYFDIINNFSDYIDWTTPWRLTLTYNLRYSTNVNYLNFVGTPDNQIVQTLSATGEITPTPNWKVTFQTGWDFNTNKLSYTSLGFYRDLHCFEMSFNWIPIGNYKSWNFQINVKAEMLKDLKLTKKKGYLD